MSEFLAVQDTMPESMRGRTNALGEKIEKILVDPTLHGKAVCVVAFDLDDEKKARASSAVQALRVKYGRDATSLGLTFAVGRVKVPAEGRDGEFTDKAGVWVHCDPSKVVAGVYEKHQTDEKAKVAVQNQKKKATEVKKGTAKGRRRLEIMEIPPP